MPSANGVYSLPVGYLAVTGTTIQASQHNPPLEDIAAALTARLSRDGTAAMTGGLQGIPGTAALPSYAVSTDTTTGIYKTTNGLGIAVAGTQVAEFTAAGLKGTLPIGAIFEWTGSNAPPLCVLPAGQTLSRTTYAELWAFAQTEIAAGNILYNNGDGSTTFGVPDYRGRVGVTRDSLLGSDANRLNNSPSMVATRVQFGGVGGLAGVQLTAAQLPSITSSGTNSITVNSGARAVWSDTSGGSVAAGGASQQVNSISQLTSTGSNNIAVTSNNTGNGFHENMQPSLVINRALVAGI
jgi:microcystin-dependent protein